MAKNKFYQQMGRNRVIRMSRQQIASPHAHEDELRTELRRAAQIANKRLRELEKAGFERTSSAYRYVAEEVEKGASGYHEDTKGRPAFRSDVTRMNKQELQKELAEVEIFLDRAKTSTVAGTNRHIENIMKSIKASAESESSNMTNRVKHFFRDKTNAQIADFWEHSNIRRIARQYGSDVVVQVINDTLENEAVRGDLDLVDDMLAEVDSKDWTLRGLKELARNWSGGAEDDEFLYNW